MEGIVGGVAFELSGVLCVVMLLILGGLWLSMGPAWVIIGGLYLFGLVFALNSSVHSFLIIDYADGDKAAINVGFYYMANAAGRLLGTLLSGLLFQLGGLNTCLAASVLFLLLSTQICLKLPRHRAV